MFNKEVWAHLEQQQEEYRSNYIYQANLLVLLEEKVDMLMDHLKVEQHTTVEHTEVREKKN